MEMFGSVPPPPSLSIAIMELAEKCELIYGLQLLRGKILSHKDLEQKIGFYKERPSLVGAALAP